LENKGHLSPFMLMPCAKDVCQVCAVKHDPKQPHNKQSLFYQYKFYNDNGRWPTWRDAMSHCETKVQEFWEDQLKSKGIDIDNGLNIESTKEE